MKTLITGGTGFIGSHVVDRLVKNGHEVRLFSRRPELPRRLAGGAVTVVPGDLMEGKTVFSAMLGMDVFYHIGEIRNTSRAAAEKNVRLMEGILDHLPGSGIKRFVFVSSITVAGIPSSIPGTEDTPPAVVLKDHYTWYKQRCEDILAAKGGDAEYAVIRPGVVYGPRSKSLRRMAETVAKLGVVGLPFIGRGDNAVPLVHVDDLAEAIFLAGARREAANQIFNITDGLRHAWSEFFGAIAAAAGRKLRIIPLPPALLLVPAVFGDLLSGIFGVTPDLTSYVSYVSRDVLFDTAKAKSLLGWVPAHTDLTAGVREMMGK
jgi:dihydroflavonol-4-reductase